MCDPETAAKLFDCIALPKWSRPEFLALWRKAKKKKRSELDRDGFARMSMLLVAHLVLSKGWQRTLHKLNIESEDAAQEVMSRLMEKSLRFCLLRRPSALEEELCFMKIMNTAVIRLLTDVTRSAKRKSNLLASSMDEDWTAHTEFVAGNATPDTGELSVRLASAANRLCGKHRQSRDLYNRLCSSVLKGEHIPRYDDCVRLGLSGVSADQFAEIAIGVNQIVHECAADANVTHAA